MKRLTAVNAAKYLGIFLGEHLQWNNQLAYVQVKLNCEMGILKLVSAIFYQIFILHQMIALQDYEKYFLFHLKNSFHS